MNENKIDFLNPKGIFDATAYGFSHTALVPAGGRLLFISGQSGGVGESHELSKEFSEQVKATLNNIRITLDSHDAKPEHIVKITILIVDHNLEKLKIWTEHAQEFWSGHSLPTSTLIPVPQLALEGMQIEVDAVAYLK